MSRIQKPLSPFAASCCVLFALTSCQSDDPPPHVLNDPPTAGIDSPADGATFDEGEVVAFIGRVNDNQQEASSLEVFWTSDLDGDLSPSVADADGRVEFNTINLSEGDHLIKLIVYDDDDEMAYDSVQITIYDVEDDPAITVLSPDDGDVFAVDELIEFSAVVSDLQDESSLLSVTVSTEDQTICETLPDATGVIECEDTLPEGDHRLTYTVVDRDGNDADEEIYVTVEAAEPVDTGDTGSPDDDGDGWTLADGDCDDSDADIHPDAIELCDEIDQDCDDSVDEDVTYVDWYPDDDGDGHGDDDASATLSCESLSGHSQTNDDCDDADDAIHPGAAESCDEIDQDCDDAIDEGVVYNDWYDDDDGDGFGDPDEVEHTCDPASGAVLDGSDCDDSDDAIHPGAAELCDEIDQDCDDDVDEGLSTTDWYPDEDSDGYGDEDASATTTCDVLSGYVDNDEDCDDDDDDINPSESEECDDVDQDCDDDVDEDVTWTTWYADEDGDGYGDEDDGGTSACAEPDGYVDNDEDCDDDDRDVNPGESEECDEIDQDCDDDVDEDLSTDDYWPDDDGDGYGDEDAGRTESCEEPDGYVDNDGDCDDGDRDVNPGESDDPCDSVDNDCSGSAASPASRAYEACYNDDVYYYDECDDRESVADSCTEGCADAECLDYAEETTSSGSCNTGDTDDILKPHSVSTVSDPTGEPSVTVTWRKCDSSTFTTDHVCRVYVGAVAGAERELTDGATYKDDIDFDWDAGVKEHETTFLLWPESSTFEDASCGATKTFYIGCDEDGIEAYRHSGSWPIEFEKFCE